MAIAFGVLATCCWKASCRGAAGGPDEDPEIHPDVVMLDIVDVQGKLLFPGDRVAAADLREPGDPRPDLVPAGLLRGVSRQVRDHQGPWSNKAHVALDD